MGKLLRLLKGNPLFLCCLFIFLFDIFLIIISGFNGLFGQDSFEYLKILRGYSDDKIPYSVFPGFYPTMGFLFTLVIANDIFSLQIISVLSLLFAIVYLHKILNFLYPQESKKVLYIFLIFVVSPYVLRFSLIAMSDMLNIFLCLGFIYHSFQFRKNIELKDLIILSVFGAMAIYTRYASAIIIAIPAFIIIQTIIKVKKYTLLLVPVIILSIVSIPELIIRQRFLFWDTKNGAADLAYFYVPQQWSFINYFKKDFYNIDGWQHYSYSNILFVFQNCIHPAFIFTGLLMLPFLKKIDFIKKEILLLLAIILLYALFSAGYPYQSNRYLLLTFPLILIIFYPAWLRLIEKLLLKKALSYYIFLVISIQLFLFFYSSKLIYELNRNEKIIADRINSLPPECSIYTFSIEGALKTYNGDERELVDIYSKQISSVKKPCSYLLFNYAVFSKQFEGLNPMINFNFIQNNYKVNEVEQFDEGWTLYKIN